MDQSRSKVKERSMVVYEFFGTDLPSRWPSFPGVLGIWREPPCTYLFMDAERDREVRSWARRWTSWSEGRRYHMEFGRWQQVLEGKREVGPFCLLCCHHREKECSRGFQPLYLKPGIAFGSGLHPSTRLMLRLLGRHWPKEASTGVDLGTGSGILAVASVLLGARRMVAIDCNPLAVWEATANARLNGVTNEVLGIVADGLSALRRPLDVLVMNLEWPCLLRVVRSGGWMSYRWVFMGGLLTSQWSNLVELLPDSYDVRDTLDEDDWRSLFLEKRGD